MADPHASLFLSKHDPASHQGETMVSPLTRANIESDSEGEAESESESELSRDSLYDASVSRDQPAQLLAGRYELLGLLGVGGMGSVYRAHDRELDELVAVKMLRRDLVSIPGILERFRREVKLARRVTHRNAARVSTSASTRATSS